jgi:SAM-dependent methyltransferase
MATETTADVTVTRPDLIFQTATGFMASKHLFAANELGVFEALADGPRPLDELADRLRIPARTARISADAMVALGFLEKDDGRYRNTGVSQTFLSGAGPLDLRPFLRFWNHISYPHWHRLEEAVRTNERVRGELTPEQEEIFERGVAAFQLGPSRGLAEGYDFSRHRKVVDLGGGVGTYLFAILERYPGIEATLFDLPEAAPVARESLAANSLGRRIEFVEGDFFVDPIPKGHDAVILANIVHYFDHDRNLELLRRIRSAVSPGARILAIDFWTDRDHVEPLVAALMGGEFLVLQGGDVFSDEEAKEWLAETGWRYVETMPLEGPLKAVIGEAI